MTNFSNVVPRQLADINPLGKFKSNFVVSGNQSGPATIPKCNGSSPPTPRVILLPAFIIPTILLHLRSLFAKFSMYTFKEDSGIFEIFQGKAFKCSSQPQQEPERYWELAMNRQNFELEPIRTKNGLSPRAYSGYYSCC